MLAYAPMTTWFSRGAAALLVAGLCAFVGCDKGTAPPKPSPAPAPAPTPPGPAPAPTGPDGQAIDEALPGVDLTGLAPEARQQFFRLTDRVQSPCGKAQSLRVSLKNDPSCQRAPFAARWLVEMARAQNGLDLELAQLYAQRYKPGAVFQLAEAACSGPADAKATVTEFFDFGCPHCKQLAGLGGEILAKYPGKVRVCYLMFPLGNFPLSDEAAAAAVAANAQGKYHGMASALFERQGKLEPTTFPQLASQLGLDQARFASDMAAAKNKVRAQLQQGIAAGVQSTPTFFVNGREVTEPRLEVVSSLIDEELALAAAAP